MSSIQPNGWQSLASMLCSDNREVSTRLTPMSMACEQSSMVIVVQPGKREAPNY